MIKINIGSESNDFVPRILTFFALLDHISSTTSSVFTSFFFFYKDSQTSRRKRMKKTLSKSQHFLSSLAYFLPSPHASVPTESLYFVAHLIHVLLFLILFPFAVDSLCLVLRSCLFFVACHTGYSRCVRRVRKTVGRVKIQSKGVQQIRQKVAPRLSVYTDYSGFQLKTKLLNSWLSFGPG